MEWSQNINPDSNKTKQKFRFDDLFDSIDNAINTADVQKDSHLTILNKIERDIEPTKAYPLFKKIKRIAKNKISKSKEVGKCINKLKNHFKNIDVKDKPDVSLNQNELVKFMGAIFMTTARTFNEFQNKQNIPKSKFEKKNKTPDDICWECFDKIDGNHFRWSECSDFVVWEEWEEDWDHEHVFYKIKEDKSTDSKMKWNGVKPWITNFPVPETFGTNCWQTPLNSNLNWSDFDFLNSIIPKRKPNNKLIQMRKYKTWWNRPAIIEAPEGPLVGSPGTYVIAEFVVENKSDHNLAKQLFLKKTSADDIQLIEIEDTDRLPPGQKKKVDLPLFLPQKKGTYIWTFSYFNINNKKTGGDFIVKIIWE